MCLFGVRVFFVCLGFLTLGVHEELLAEEFEIEVIDVLSTPREALKANVLATPALAITSPSPVRTVVGDLSDARRVLLTLGIRAAGEGT